jgi:phytoene desaturase
MYTQTGMPSVARASAATQPHAIVIGSGFGGLAAAVRLGARGYRVTVLEKLDAPGGRAYVYRQDGFTFDAGPTVITAPFLLEELWALCGKKMADHIDLRPVSPYYRIRFDDGSVFDYCGDAAAMRAEVARFAPADVAGYECFLKASEAIYKVGFEQLGHVPFNSWADMARVLPALLKLEGYRTVYSLASKHVRNPKLRVVLTFQSLLVGGNPFSTTSVYCLIAFLERRWGVHFAMGGTGSLVNGLVKLIEGQGNQVRCDQAVDKITVSDGRATGVRLASGELIPADVVVSNADSASTYRYLVAPEHRRRWTDKRIEKARYSMSLFVWYFGTRRQYPDVAHHTIAGPALQGAAGRHLRPQAAGRGLQPVPAPAHRDRSVAGAPGLRRVLCAVARAAPAKRHRLAGHGRTVPPGAGAPPARHPAAGAERRSHQLARAHAA